jgi:hypothetical protein
MADEASEPQLEETPEVTPPEAGTEAESPPASGEGTPGEEQTTDWERRYKDLQSAYTQTSQEAAQLREAQEQAEAEQAIVEALSDPEQQEQTFAYLVQELGQEEATAWAEAHGFEVDLEDEEGQEVRDPRVDLLLAKEAQKEAQQFAQQVEKGMEETLDACLQEKNLSRDKLPEGVVDLLLDAALARGMQTQDQDVNGALKAVFGQWHTAREAELKAYRQSKRDTPSTPVPGSSGTPNPSFGDRQERLARANSVVLESLTEP